LYYRHIAVPEFKTFMQNISTNPQAIPCRADWALFLDIDGTILEIAERPDLVVIADGLPILLNDLGNALGNAAALLSGRTLANIDELFPDVTLACAGIHGLEMRSSDGVVSKSSPPDELGEELAEIRHRVTAFAREFPDLIVEDKVLSIAVHYRARADLANQIRQELTDLISDADGLAVLDGKMVIEIKPENHDKGSAIRELMAKPPFFGRVPLFFGDDKTDEFGFAVVNELGGLSVKVGAMGETNAQCAIENVAAVHAWLNGYRTYLARETSS
jgi:trehalose 6-phosphate phosphatase